jgi:hypothetical protein
MISNHYSIALGHLGLASRSADGAGLGPHVPLHGWPARAAHPELSCRPQHFWVCANDCRCHSASGSGSSGTRCIRTRAPPPPPRPHIMDCTHGFCGRSESVHSRRAPETVRTLSSLATMHVPRARVQWTTSPRPALVLRWPASRPAHTSHSARDSLPRVDHGHHAYCMFRTAMYVSYCWYRRPTPVSEFARPFLGVPSHRRPEALAF